MVHKLRPLVPINIWAFGFTCGQRRSETELKWDSFIERKHAVLLLIAKLLYNQLLSVFDYGGVICGSLCFITGEGYHTHPRLL